MIPMYCTLNLANFYVSLRGKNFPYIYIVMKQCFQQINVLKSMCGISFGSDPLCIIKLYTVLVTPKLEYMCSRLLGASQRDLFTICRVQRKCLRLFLGAMASTHTLGIPQTADAMPLSDRFRLNANIVINNI